MRLLLPLLLLVPLVVAAQPSAGSCPVFPADNPWNVDISGYPVHPMSATWISSIDASSSKHTLHPDWGTIPQWGIPYIYVGAGQPLVPVTYDAYGDESDPGPMPIPPEAPIEGFDATS